LWHGLFLSLERFVPAQWSEKAGQNRILQVCSWAYALLVVMVGWVMFRCETMDQAMAFFKAMGGMGLKVSDLSFITHFRLLFLFLCILFAAPVFRRWAFPSGETLTFFKFATADICLVLSLPVILSSGYSPFLYFRF